VSSIEIVEHDRYERELAEIAENKGAALFAVARRYLPSADDAADAVQDAFVSAFRALPRFQGGSKLDTWLHRILINTCLMKLRSQPKRRTVSFDALTTPFAASPRSSASPTSEQIHEDASDREEIRKFIRRYIALLPDDYRTVVQMRDIDQLNTAQTAKALGVANGTVKTRLHRARQALRKLLEPEFADNFESSLPADRNAFQPVASN